jgi:hypothetical protein
MKTSIVPSAHARVKFQADTYVYAVLTHLHTPYVACVDRIRLKSDKIKDRSILSMDEI